MGQHRQRAPILAGAGHLGRPTFAAPLRKRTGAAVSRQVRPRACPHGEPAAPPRVLVGGVLAADQVVLADRAVYLQRVVCHVGGQCSAALSTSASEPGCTMTASSAPGTTTGSTRPSGWIWVGVGMTFQLQVAR